MSKSSGDSAVSNTKKEQFESKDLQTSSRTEFTEFVIHTFSPEKVPIKVSLHKNCLVADVKFKAGEHLHLNKISLEMFGLFVGPLGCPTKYIPDQVTVDDYTEFCLQRIVFNGGHEILLVRYDTNALDLLYWEMRFIYNKKWRSDEEYPSVRDKIKYVGNIHAQKDYWKYYYRIHNCTLYRKLIVGRVRLPSGTPIRIALNAESFYILNIHDSVILCCEWQQVADVMIHINTKSLVKFRMRTRDKRIIAVLSKESADYLFSLAIHIIEMNEKKFGVRSTNVVPCRIHDFLVVFNNVRYGSVKERKKPDSVGQLVPNPQRMDDIEDEESQTESIDSGVLTEGVKGSDPESQRQIVRIRNAAIDHVQDQDYEEQREQDLEKLRDDLQCQRSGEAAIDHVQDQDYEEQREQDLEKFQDDFKVNEDKLRDDLMKKKQDQDYEEQREQDLKKLRDDLMKMNEDKLRDELKKKQDKLRDDLMKKKQDQGYEEQREKDLKKLRDDLMKMNEDKRRDGLMKKKQDQDYEEQREKVLKKLRDDLVKMNEDKLQDDLMKKKQDQDYEEQREKDLKKLRDDLMKMKMKESVHYVTPL